MGPPPTFAKCRTVIFNCLHTCSPKKEKKHKKWECRSQVCLGEYIWIFRMDVHIEPHTFNSIENRHTYNTLPNGLTIQLGIPI